MTKDGRQNKTAVCVGSITDDVRLLKVPKLKVRFQSLYYTEQYYIPESEFGKGKECSFKSRVPFYPSAINPYSLGIDFSHQNPMSADVRF